MIIFLNLMYMVLVGRETYIKIYLIEYFLIKNTVYPKR